MIGGASAQVVFGGYTSLYQINAVVPAGTPSGNAAVTIQFGVGQDAERGVIAVQQ
jgi:uncharacterized protein (TIGR03437 family)